MRIISTVPSQTELLSALDLESEVKGITKFCVHPPEWYKEKTRIGGTKSLDIEKIKELKPDLILCNKEENIKAQVLELKSICQVHISDIKNPEDNLNLIRTYGDLTNRRYSSLRLITEYAAALNSIEVEIQKKTAYLIWRDPYMTVGNDTYIHSMMTHCGFINAFGQFTRYPEVSIEDLRNKNLELLLLSSEPYPFSSKHLKELQNLLPGVQIKLVDGEAFSWYGTRLIHTANYLRQLIKDIQAGL